ncbi:MAG: hypothetical protein ACYCOU_00770 [Sulfobacillus sp.]
MAWNVFQRVRHLPMNVLNVIVVCMFLPPIVISCIYLSKDLSNVFSALFKLEGLYVAASNFLWSARGVWLVLAVFSFALAQISRHAPAMEVVAIQLQLQLFPAEDQNVHDPGVQGHLRQAVARLRAACPRPPPPENCLNEFRNRCKNMEGFVAADQTLAFMQRHNEFVTNLDARELEVFSLVWSRINDPANEKNCAQLLSTLTEELADCLAEVPEVFGEPRVPVCAQGRVARILQTLEILDAEGIMQLRPLWAIKEDIAQRFAHCRSEVLKRVKQSARREYESPEDNDTQRKIGECISENVRRRLSRDYVKPGILTQERLDELTRDYFAAL